MVVQSVGNTKPERPLLWRRTWFVVQVDISGKIALCLGHRLKRVCEVAMDTLL